MRISLETVEPLTGMIVYRGPSKLTGEPIIVLVTGLKGSENIKTGNMVQTYILMDGIHPTEGVFEGKDKGICGDCPHRYVDGEGTCYVNPANGPLSVYNAFRRGNYKVKTLDEAADILAGRVIRLGSYGDPAAVPVTVWDTILKKAHSWTGYTHQWRKYHARGLKRYCMASIENTKDFKKAKKMGWRTFRIRTLEMPLMPGEIICPASKEAGNRRECVTCRACDGGRNSKVSVAIVAHGPIWKRQRLEKMIAA